MPYIYMLIDPRNNRVRYIGKSNDPNKRYQMHLWDINNSNPRKRNWIKTLRQKGMKPILSVIEICSDDEWQKRERYWIAKYRKDHPDLLNITDGGDDASDKAKKAWGEAYVRAMARRWNIKPKRCFICHKLTIAHTDICGKCTDKLDDGGAWFQFYIEDHKRETNDCRAIKKREFSRGLRLENEEKSEDVFNYIVKRLEKERIG